MSRHALDPTLFRPEAVSEETAAFNAQMRTMPPVRSWREMSLEERRQVSFGPAPRSERARTIIMEAVGRKITLHVVAPPSPKGVYMHLHGGGLVMSGADRHDPMLDRIVDTTGLACVSVGYRLAPEHPYPAAWDDAEAAALWLAKNAKTEFGAELAAIGGESAGATLAVPTLVRLRDKHGFTGFKAANLSYGNYDTSGSPSQTWIGAASFPINKAAIDDCSNAYAPDVGRRRDPDMSAAYAKLDRMPPALFTVGTLDPFLDDSLYLYVRWIAAGNEAELAIYPGGVHGFNNLPIPLAREANDRIDAFLNRHAGG
ncbi:MAG: alpha/beta hydrolase fold domain-containing protein [Hyphomonadaceae bacterium]|nr:alpha/beta hydrolase fold domain-containing protein [Hyphomonadaceae bacterium]